MISLSDELTFVHDPGHGWLRVPRSELAILGIAEEISTCSYVNGRYVYLEQDADLGTYMVARLEQGYPSPRIVEQYVPSFDRNLPCYQPPPPKKTAEQIDVDLRALWEAEGVSQEEQAAILADLTHKASPHYLSRLFQPKPAFAQQPSLYVCYAEQVFTVPQGAAEADKEVVITAVTTFRYLLNRPELRRERVSYMEFAHLIRNACSHERAGLYAETLERLSGWQQDELGDTAEDVSFTL